MSDSAASARRPNLIERVTAWALSLKPVRAFYTYLEHGGPMLADSITYRTLFSVSAGVLLGFSLAGLWLGDNPVAYQALVDAVDAAIPGLVGENGIVDPSTLTVSAGLSIAGLLALFGLVGASIGAIGSLRFSLRRLADKAHDSVFWIWVLVRNFLLALAIGAGLVASAFASMFGTAFIRVLMDWLGLGAGSEWSTWALSVLIVLALDTGVIILLFLSLSGVKPSARALWPGALLGAAALTVLQQLSGLFVAGAAFNPVLASFASLIALLLWLNLSSQVILIASAYIITGVEEDVDRVRARHGSPTFAKRRLRKAEDAVRVATEELEAARVEEAKERSHA